MSLTPVEPRGSPPKKATLSPSGEIDGKVAPPGWWEIMRASARPKSQSHRSNTPPPATIAEEQEALPVREPARVDLDKVVFGDASYSTIVLPYPEIPDGDEGHSSAVRRGGGVEDAAKPVAARGCRKSRLRLG